MSTDEVRYILSRVKDSTLIDIINTYNYASNLIMMNLQDDYFLVISDDSGIFIVTVIDPSKDSSVVIYKFDALYENVYLDIKDVERELNKRRCNDKRSSESTCTH